MAADVDMLAGPNRIERTLMRCTVTGRVAAATLSVIAATAIVIAQTPAGEQQAGDPLAGMLPDGSNYRVVKPARWNGTLILDLDFANNPSAPPSVGLKSAMNATRIHAIASGKIRNTLRA